jgi:hypothetical protein
MNPEADRRADTQDTPTEFVGLSSRAYLVTACALILAGAALRTLGYFEPIEFWLDESMWAVKFANGTLGTLRPPGYSWLSLQLIELRATEPVIRSVSYAAGLISLPLLLATLRAAGLRRSLCLLGLFVLAVHPVAITFSKEFKPYALELSLHLGLLALAFAYARSLKWWPLVTLCALAICAPFFAWSVVVLYPGLFVAVALVSLRRREKARLAVIALGCLATAGVLLWLYVTIHAERKAGAAYRGNKYDVFFVGEGLIAHLRWLIEKTYELLSFPGHLKIFWFDAGYPNPYLAALQAVMAVGGLVAIAARRRWLWALLWVSPWFVTVGLNLIGKWPYGVFRTNLFMFAYSLPLALAGLDALGRWLGRRFERPFGRRLRGVHLVPAFCLLYALVCLPFSASYFSHKPTGTLAATQSTRRAMEIIAAVEREAPSPFRQREGRDLLLLDSHAYGNFRFYRSFHPETKDALGPFLTESFRPMKGGYKAPALLKRIERESRWGFWLVVAKPSLAGPAWEEALRHCHVDNVAELPQGNLVLRCLSKTR